MGLTQPWLSAPLLRSLYEFVFPPVCVACGRSLPDAPSRVCPACWSSINPVVHENPLYQRTLERLREGGFIDRLVVPFLFEKDGTLQLLLHQVKYQGMQRLAGLLGEAVGEALRMTELLDGVSGLVPVPLHRSKVRERGYNQSAEIARGIGRVSGLAVWPRVIVRTKRTVSQTTLTLEERKRNVSHAFAVPSAARPFVRGRILILVDDVVTTGSTLEACAEVLAAAGAKRIIACAVAMAPRLLP